jgi:hypothetical protein
LIPEETETVEQMVLFKALKDLDKDGIEMVRGDRIEEGADVIVTGNLLDAQQGVRVVAPRGGLEQTLVLQKRWRLGKEEAEGTESRILHTVARIVAFATVGQVIDLSLESGPEILEAYGVGHRCLLGARG